MTYSHDQKKTATFANFFSQKHKIGSVSIEMPIVSTVRKYNSRFPSRDHYTGNESDLIDNIGTFV